MFFNACTVVLYLMTALAPMMTGCSPAAVSGRASDAGQARGAESGATEVNLTLLVKRFAGDEGPGGREAWEKLSAYPRMELISSLTRLRTSAPEDDPLRVDIAFVLCNLDYEYKANRQAVVSAFTNTERPDIGEERLITRLIRKGDEDLLTVLFSASGRADGALSEGLADTFAEQVLKDPETFLRKLKSEPLSTRRKVYELLDESVLSEKNLRDVKSYLASVLRDPSVGAAADEMLKALNARRQ